MPNPAGLRGVLAIVACLAVSTPAPGQNLWARNVISGFPDGTFGPALFVTRGAMSTFLANGFNMKLY
ncbi:MAG TPA: S-layer homology domain-containing protein [Thermoanaerobaculia bacterium]|nr:S-layer homology domain-containing protein [Thermoanaerobaculia bacterium]